MIYCHPSQKMLRLRHALARFSHQLEKVWLPFLYPTHCPVCDKLLPYGTDICTYCKKQLPLIRGSICYCCGKPLSDSAKEYCYDCTHFPKTFENGLALFVYNERTKPAMMALKYHNQRTLASFFADAIYACHGTLLKNRGIQALIPIPIHKNKKKKRGYNQAELLCKQLAYRLGLPYYPNFLIRTIDTLPQKIFSPQARLNNLQKAFALNPLYADMANRLHCILLVDDIYTSGATMESCTRILKRAGVSTVFIYSVCIGISRDF